MCNKAANSLVNWGILTGLLVVNKGSWSCEFSSYTVTIIAVFSATFEITPASSNLEFTTLSAGMIKHIHMYACR